jgi:hypothetical protein
LAARDTKAILAKMVVTVETDLTAPVAVTVTLVYRGSRA